MTTVTTIHRSAPDGRHFTMKPAIRTAGSPPSMRPRVVLQLGQSRVGVAEAVERDSHPLHDAEIQTAHLAVLVAGVEIVERPPGLERSAETAGEHHRQARADVGSARP